MKAFKIVDTKYGPRINVLTSYSELNVIKSLPWDITKRAWEPNEKCWQVVPTEASLELLGAVNCIIEPEVVKWVLAQKQLAESNLLESKATNAEIMIPAPDGLAYMPFQKAGIAYSVKNQNTLIADEMGLGKTIQAIGVINMEPSIKTVIVVCPASLKINWRNELQKWLTRPMELQVVNNGDTLTGDVLIINYDIVHKMVDQLPAADFIILDESHYIKNPKAKRTKATIEIAKRASKRVLLTGTPIKNRPIELWTQVHLLRPDVFNNWWNYAKRYCGAYRDRYGMVTGGATNIDELYAKLRTTCMVRRLKKDVLTELPAKVRQIIELPVNGSAKILKEEADFMARREDHISALHAAVEMAKASDDEGFYQEAVKALREAYQVAFTEMARIRKEVAVSKIPYVISHIENIIEDGEKVILFAHHREVCQKVYEAFKGQAVILTGETPNANRQMAVDSFQNDDNIKVFVGSLHAAGVGITLTASSRVVFAELDWTPAIMQQAEDRAHRIGQENNVVIQYLVLEGSLDSKMAKDIADKLKVIERALDKGQIKDREDLTEVKQGLVQLVEENATKSVKRTEVAKLAIQLTIEQIAEVHSKLIKLADMCDDARSLDGSGFNKIDTYIGKSLAGSYILSPKQAVLGAKIVKKYHGQVGKLSFTI